MIKQVQKKGENIIPRNKLGGNGSQIISAFFAHPSVMFVIIAELNSSRYRSSVELNSTALFSVPGPVSSQIRQRFSVYQIKHRVKFDSAFQCTRSSVKLNSTALFSVPGPV